MFKAFHHPGVWLVTLLCAMIMMVTMGTRQTMGLFLGPLNTSTGLGMATLSLAMAIGQFVWGAVQPISGALADRYGPRPVLIGGLLMLAAGSALTPFMETGFGLMLSVGLMAAIGSGSCSFSVLIGVASQRIPAQTRGSVSGFINAGGSFGQFVFAPLTQRLIQTLGWMGAMWSLAVITLLAIPLANKLTGIQAPPQVHAQKDLGLGQTIKDALKDPSYIFLHLGFFTCGFHIAFLITHLPTEVGLCGLPASVASWSLAIIGLANIVGSIVAGASVGKYRSKMVLALMYGSRCALIGLYLLAPKTDLTFYVFAAGLGFTWLATVPPTATLVGKLFGVRYLGTLFGLTLFTHQIGGFLGAYLGGLAIIEFGDYQWMWYADMALALFAALINLPIKELKMPATHQTVNA
jgi:MFS family permease